MSLAIYHKKRNFENTKEPQGEKSPEKKFRFVVQRHQASRLHYDFRLELGGVLKSWAVPKGPSLNPLQKRLAVHVEDHPASYIHFEGIIPEGNYGAGKVEVWDKGNFVPLDNDYKKISEHKALQALREGELKFNLKGKKLKGGFVLVQLQNDKKNWLLIKHKDQYAVNTNYNAEKIAAKKTKNDVFIKQGKGKNVILRKTHARKRCKITF